MPTEVRNSRKLQESCRTFLETSAKLCARHDFLHGIERDLRSISASVTHPFNVAVFGKMKRGKSSLVNALFGRTLAITDQTEATATINIISYAPPGSELLTKFVIHWKDAPAETFPFLDLKKWTGPDGQFDRIEYIQMYADDPSLKYHEIIDTPGTESTVEKHQAATADFIDPAIQVGRKADALVYVLGYNVEESDLKYLRLYQRHNSSDSFNVLAVMHRWDDTYVDKVKDGYCLADVMKRAEGKRKELGNLATDVVPVSAPIAIFLNSCEKRDEYVARAIDLYSGMGDKDLDRLKVPSRFSETPERKALLDEILATGMPKASAWVLFIEAARHGREGVKGIVERLAELSGLERLETILDKRFFSRGEIVRQGQTCNRIAAVKTKFDNVVDAYLRQCEKDSVAWERLSEVPLQDKSLADWVLTKRNAFAADLASINECVERIDRIFIDSPVGRLRKDTEARSWIFESDIFWESEKKTIADFLDSFMGIEEERVDLRIVESVIKKALLGIRSGRIHRRRENLVRHLQSRLNNHGRNV